MTPLLVPNDEICRKIVGEILVQWFDEWEGKFPISDDDKEFHLTEMTEILLTKTSVPKMVEVLEKANRVPRNDANLRRWAEEIRELTYDVLTPFQGDKPVEENDET